MNSGLLEARELASRISRTLRGEGPSSLLDEFATETHDTWRRLLDADSMRALPGTAVAPAVRSVHGGVEDPWVRQNGARILASLPASGDELEPLLKQIGLTAAPSRRGAEASA
jgi:hypothetical protein